MNTSPMFLALLNAENDAEEDDGSPPSAPSVDNDSSDDEGEDDLSSQPASSANGSGWRQSGGSDSSVSTENVHAKIAALDPEPPRDEVIVAEAEGNALTEETGLILAARQLEISLDLVDDDGEQQDEGADASEDFMAEPDKRGLLRQPATGLIGTKMVRHLKPASTETSRTEPLPRRSIANRNSCAFDGVRSAGDLVPQMNETSLAMAIDHAAKALAAGGEHATSDALRHLRAVQDLELSTKVPTTGSDGAVPNACAIMRAAPGDEHLGAQLAPHLARWAENEENSGVLCSAEGLELLLTLIEQNGSRVREPTSVAFAGLCAMPAGAVALSTPATVARVCAAVRAHIEFANARGVNSGHGSGPASGAASVRQSRQSSGSDWRPNYACGGDEVLPDAAVAAAKARPPPHGGDPHSPEFPTAASCANLMRGLKKLALSAEGRRALTQGGALVLVVEVARAHSTSNSVVEQSTRIIGNVAIDPEHEDAIIQSGCVQLLCAHLTATDPSVLSADAGALANLISNPTVRSIIVAHGCVGPICNVVSGPMKDRPEVYKHASWLLTSLAVEHESRAHVLANGGLQLLVAHCARDTPQFHEEGAWALANLSADVRNAIPIVEAGALPVLFALVNSDSASVQLQATWVFANLSVVDELKAQIGAHDGFVEALYAGLERTAHAPDAHRALRLQTIRTLANLAVDVSNRHRVASGLQTAKDTLVRSNRDDIAQATLRLIVNLSYDPQIASTMLADGVLVEALVKACSSDLEAIQQESVLCFVNLSLDEHAESTLIAAGAIAPLVTILQSSSQVLQEQAAWALSNITTSRESKMLAIELGALHTLKSLHRSSSGQMRQASTKIMNSLLSMVTPQSRKVFLPANATIRDSHRGRSPLVDSARASSARRPGGSALARSPVPIPQDDAGAMLDVDADGHLQQ
mmetsp:Transcript_7150/g.20716  ORF Transcript_7150/g.20716 Transcript_7150/m.20716 type:complete len:927 (-) Transcript_7150:583-3363(-)